MPALTMLSLTGNNISYIDPAFLKNVTDLRYLYLAENAIKNVNSTILKQFGKVEIFDLSYNNVPDLTQKQFSIMDNLQHLNLEANNIREIAAGAFASTPLILLWLPYNCLTNVSADIFQGIPFLKQLSLAHNNILSVQVGEEADSKAKTSDGRVCSRTASLTSPICIQSIFRTTKFSRSANRRSWAPTFWRFASKVGGEDEKNDRELAGIV